MKYNHTISGCAPYAYHNKETMLGWTSARARSYVILSSPICLLRWCLVGLWASLAMVPIYKQFTLVYAFNQVQLKYNLKMHA